MTFVREVGSGVNRATDYHDWIAKQVAAMTSQHVATVAVNAGGSGYVVGEIITLTHAGAVLDAKFEVVTVSSGAVTALRIISNGAFSNRLASAAVAAGGSGYAVGDVLEIQGGTAREKAKVAVATLSGSAVATVTVFETGGAYSSAPGAGSATVGVGPNGFAGNDACTLNPTMTGLIGTTGLSTTASASGTGLTVDITLAETGWSVDGRNTNDASFNGVLDEKEVVLVGDASGKTNKPYIGFASCTYTSGINTRYAVAILGLIAHNPLTALSAQVAILGDPGTFSDGTPYLLFPENQTQEIDFWTTIDDNRVGGEINTNPGAANTDDGEYFDWYVGFGDSYATETEAPYPMLVHGSARSRTLDPSVGTTSISGIHECGAPTGTTTGTWFWSDEDASWINVRNTNGFNTSPQQRVMAPLGNIVVITDDPDQIVTSGPLEFWTGIGSMTRGSPTRRLRPVPGTTDHHLPIPLTVLSRPGGNSLDDAEDLPRLQPRGFFWIYNTDDTGATINNFSEDFITIGSDRYRVFHNHVQTELYQYICIKEDV
jgi:hypothetical protein